MRSRGGAALLLAVSVLTLGALLAVLASRVVLRERVVEGEVLLGARASLAADSALAWFLAEGWRGLPEPGEPEAVLPVPVRVFRPEPGLAQGGEVRARCLGPSILWPGTRVWRLTVRGRVTAGGRGPPFVQTREVYLTQAERAQPVKRAWRIVR